MVDRFAGSWEVETILDYGAGKGVLAETLKHRKIWSYDPCVERFSREPKPADFLVCIGTIEHVEPECLDAVLDHMESLTKKVAFLVVSTRHALVPLPDGRDAHLIVKPLEWWLPQLMARWTLKAVERWDNAVLYFGMKRANG